MLFKIKFFNLININFLLVEQKFAQSAKLHLKKTYYLTFKSLLLKECILLQVHLLISFSFIIILTF